MLYLPSFVKQCSKCHTFRLLSEFQKNKQTKDKLQSRCRYCQNADNRRAYQIHGEKTREHQKEYRQTHADALRERQRRFVSTHREWKRAYAREWKRKQRQKTVGIEYHRAMLRYHHNKRRPLIPAKRNRQPKDTPGVFTYADVARQYQAQDGKCYWCGCDLNDAYQPDHVIPVSRGGSNDPSNIVCACPHCNQSKGAKLPNEWLGNKISK